MENSYGAKIYVDPIGRSAVRIDDHDIEFCQEIPVSVQGDQYMDPYATMYLVVVEPLKYNQWGIEMTKPRGKRQCLKNLKHHHQWMQAYSNK